MAGDDVLQSIIGKPTGKARVVVERGPVASFAAAVKETNPVYSTPEAAAGAGFAAIPAPPTYPFVMEKFGAFPEIQPADAPSGSALMDAMRPLLAKGGLILHGEQEFTYHRPVLVGDVLLGESTIVDAYEKESKGKTMTFLVAETVWTDDRSGEPVVTSRMNLIHRV